MLKFLLVGLLLCGQVYGVGVETINLTSPGPNDVALYDPELDDIRDGLVLEYDFASGSVTYCIDQSGSYNHGTITGAKRTGGPGGSEGMYLDGGDYVDSGNAVPLQLSTGTIVAWFRTDDAGASYRGIVAKNNAWGLLVYDNILITYDWGGGGGTRTTSTLVDDNNWHQAVLTFQDGVTGGTRVYLDGELEIITTITIVNQNENVFVGTTTATAQQFTGRIGKTRIYNKILTAQEVGQLYQYDRQRFDI